ncbi:hypothetical protein R1sor_025039 [Riccia sorocarpa]|uniref:Uncharacterized protein n=1 Tax=Riccia sorocarpa TaxID=122646 RepID=A0ABD3G8Z3_9MARC
MESKVKVENARGKATTEVANSSGRVGEVGCVTGTGDTSKSKKVDVPNGELDTAWAEEDFILSEDYFAKECRLPNDGVMPNDITKTLVSDEEVERCFGPRSGTNGRNGPKLNNCVGLPQSEVLHYSGSVIPEVRPVKLASPASYMPGFIELKDDIAVREKLIAKLRADITALTKAIAGFRGDLLLANESTAKAVSAGIPDGGR